MGAKGPELRLHFASELCMTWTGSEPPFSLDHGDGNTHPGKVMNHKHIEKWLVYVDTYGMELEMEI